MSLPCKFMQFSILFLFDSGIFQLRGTVLTNRCAVTKDEEVQYTSIIDSILATADLNTVTRKKIRAGLQMALGGKDLSDHKVCGFHCEFFFFFLFFQHYSAEGKAKLRRPISGVQVSTYSSLLPLADSSATT